MELKHRNVWQNTLKVIGVTFSLALNFTTSALANVAQTPLFLTQGVEPQVMLTLSNDHQLFFEAYPDYLDLNGDGLADQGYLHSNDYYGYFDSYKCYDYRNGRFEPQSITESKYCDGADAEWSGNFLNYVTMSRMDVVRKILFGGYRRVDDSDLTVLERAYVPTDAHSWVRYYDKTDINRLTPFENTTSVSATSNSNVEIGIGSKQFTLSTGTSGFLSTAQLGDQVQIYRGSVKPSISDPRLADMMLGKITAISSSNSRVTVDVQSANGAGIANGWTLDNLSRAGITFCNTTNNASLNGGETVPSTKAPRMSVARGNYSLWNANERYQCRWSTESSNANANNVGLTQFPANDRNPVKASVGLGDQDYIVRVEACRSSLIGQERCKEYPDGNYKPIGLLQQYGDDNQILFGLISGSYLKNRSGGVVRKNISDFGNEVNVATDGTFTSPPNTGGIVHSLNLLRMYGYGSDGVYTQSPENCPFGLRDFVDGQCASWGNPQSEILLEAMRYFAGKSPTSAFTFDGDDRLAGLRAQPWQDSLNNDLYCAPLNVINFNSSSASFDRDQLGSAADLPGITSVSALRQITNEIGVSESISGREWFVGESGAQNNQLCTSKVVGELASVAGLCPEAPRLSGGYDAVGIAHHAYTTDMRPDLTGDQFVKTFAVALAPAVPRIDIPALDGSGTVATILPACRNTNDGGNCAIVDFKVVRQDTENGTGLFLVNWEAAEQGGDYDQDMLGTLEYRISGSVLEVTTRVAEESTSRSLGFGYVLNGTDKNGFHAHSGVNGYSYSDPTGAISCNNCQVRQAATTATYVIRADQQSEGLLESPMFYAAKWSGYDKQGDFPNQLASWDANGDGLPDNYYFAIDPSRLATDLELVFADILRSSSAAATIAANSSSLTTDTSVFQASFNSQSWSGDLRAFSIEADGEVADTFNWSAASKLDNLSVGQLDERNIITSDPVSLNGAEDGELISSSAKPFEWDELTLDQQTSLRNNLDGTQASETIGELRLEYLRGDRSNERTPTNPSGLFRERESRLGDIINSNPQFVFQENFGYSSLALATVNNSQVFSGATGYTAFKTSTAGRPPIVVVGANDGMLHGFNASDGAEGGEELFAYVPSEVISNLAELTEFGYTHRYYVDGSPRVADAYLGGSLGWKTIAVGTTGAGGNSVFALDITDPENVTEDSFLWEFTHPDMGRTIQQPAIVPMPNGEFAVIVTSGYRDNPLLTGGKVWVLNATTGRPITTIELPDSGQLGSPLAVDLNNDRIVDRVYVGDTLGQLWRIDTEGSNAGQWGVPGNLRQGNTDQPLFTTADGQPITAPLASAFNVKGQHMVYFGTGTFFRQGDNIVGPDPEIQAFYGIIDEDSTGPLTVSDLLAQEILTRVTVNSLGLTVLSDYQLNNQKGWYLDLNWKPSLGGLGPQGERVTARALVRGDRVIFTSLIPSSDPCAAGGQSWLYEVDALSGSRLEYSVFDVSGDLNFNEEDYVEVEIDGETVRVPPSGLNPDIGIINTPTILREGGGDERKVFTGSSGQIISVPEKGSVNRGRQNWEQIR